MGTQRTQFQNKVICTVTTKARNYEICGPIFRLDSGNKYVTVNIIAKGKGLIKRVIVEDYNQSPTPWGTGLGNVPQELYECIDTIFCNLG